MVSHSLVTIRSLTERCLWLDKGILMMDGATEAVATTYEEHERSKNTNAPA
jgi:teichoic acid transport system ATP-binding protein